MPNMKSVTQRFVEILKKSSMSTVEKVPLLLDLISVVENRDQELLTIFDDYSDTDIVTGLEQELRKRMEDTI